MAIREVMQFSENGLRSFALGLRVWLGRFLKSWRDTPICDNCSFFKEAGGEPMGTCSHHHRKPVHQFSCCYNHPRERDEKPA